MSVWRGWRRGWDESGSPSGSLTHMQLNDDDEGRRKGRKANYTNRFHNSPIDRAGY